MQADNKVLWQRKQIREREGSELEGVCGFRGRDEAAKSGNRQRPRPAFIPPSTARVYTPSVDERDPPPLASE